MSDPTGRSADLPPPGFGEPEAEFRPTFGQTAAGLLIHGSCAAALFACAALDTEGDAFKRLVIGSVGVTSSAMAYWVYALRKWRLWVCPGGVVQRTAWGSEAIAWTEVREAVVERHVLARNPDNVMLVRSGPGGNVTVQPINCGRWKEAVATVIEAVHDRGITVRTVTTWGR